MPDATQKPGWQTSEFWSHMAVQVAIALITFLLHSSPSLPPVASAIITAMGPLAMAWLQSQYSEDRTSVKVAALTAGKAAGASQGGSAGPGSPVAS